MMPFLLSLDGPLKRFTTKNGGFSPEIHLLSMVNKQDPILPAQPFYSYIPGVRDSPLPTRLFLYGWTAEYYLFYIIPLPGTATAGFLHHEYSAPSISSRYIWRICGVYCRSDGGFMMCFCHGYSVGFLAVL